MIPEGEQCGASGMAAPIRITPSGRRQGWCGRCLRYIPATPGGKLKRHRPTEKAR